jgi:hypothetical protein
MPKNKKSAKQKTNISNSSNGSVDEVLESLPKDKRKK